MVDWSTGNVYFSKLGSQEVTVCSDDPNKQNQADDCLVILSISSVTAITHLALDPAEGSIFIAGYKASHNSIHEGGVWTYGMDGQLVDGIEKLTGDKVGIPSGLTLDLVMKRVFWSDYTNRGISMCGYRGENKQVFPQF